MNQSATPLRAFAGIFVLAAATAFGQGITIDLGKTETGRYVNLVGNIPGSDGEITDMIFISPEYAARNKGISMYFAIDDSFFYQLPAGQFVLVNIEYYDAPGVQIKLVYDAAGDHGGKEYPESITTTGSNMWKSKSFTIDDAYFGNGLSHGADLQLVATAGTMTINAVSVVPYEAYYDFGSVNDSLYMHWVSYDGGDSHIQIVTREGKECVGTIGTNQYLYIDVADSFIAGGNYPDLFLSVEYFDSDSTWSMRIQYDAAGITRFKSSPYVYCKGLNSFRTFTFEIPDAMFMNRQSSGSDFRLHIPTPGLAINRILIARLPKKPLLVTNIIPNSTANKALESPVVDGSLEEWSWLAPYPIIQQYNSDSSRFDEFYRTWMLNSANVPVAEPGEAGVADPVVPGNWDPRDLGGGVSMLWDDTNLFFAVNVKDNVVNAAGANWDNKDGFGFYIDVAHGYDATDTVPVARKDDRTFIQGEHFFFFPADQAQVGTWCHSTSQTGEAMPGSITRTVVKTDSGYIIEASVPLSVIADGLTWHPGVIGDRDAFSPLFAWMVNDNDGVSGSSGRVMCGGHSADDEFWGNLFMAPIPLVDHGIMIDPGTRNYESFLTQVETQAGADGGTTPVKRAGKTAVMLSSGYLYLDINDTVWNAALHKHALVSVEYFDSASAGARFRLQYDSDSTAYHSLPYVYIGNSKTWKTAIFEIPNARFQGRQNGHADFRFSNGSKDVVMNQVKVGIADLWIDLGDSASQTAFGINETNLGGDGLRAPATAGGVNCKRNDMGYTNFARYLYFGVADSLIKNSNHPRLFVTVEYYDTTSSGGVGMNYDSKANLWSIAPGDAFILGESQWKLHTFYLPDALFNDRENGGSDFRVSGKGTGTTFINRVLIGSLDGVTTSVERSLAEPFTFLLEQNYPNPFNPLTIIHYTVGGTRVEGRGTRDGERVASGQGQVASVKLVVYDLLGREVATLVNERKAPGSYDVTFDASRLASGVYIYRLTAGSFVQTRKMLLVR